MSFALHSPPTAAILKRPRGEVRIFATWCKGCQICVEFCPTNVQSIHPSNIEQMNRPALQAGFTADERIKDTS